MSGFIAHDCREARWQQLRTSAPTNVSERRMRPFANGVAGMDTHFRGRAGRFTATGRRAGIMIRQRFAPISSISSRSKGLGCSHSLERPQISPIARINTGKVGFCSKERIHVARKTGPARLLVRDLLNWPGTIREAGSDGIVCPSSHPGRFAKPFSFHSMVNPIRNGEEFSIADT